MVVASMEKKPLAQREAVFPPLCRKWETGIWSEIFHEAEGLLTQSDGIATVRTCLSLKSVDGLLPCANGVGMSVRVREKETVCLYARYTRRKHVLSTP